MTVIGEVESAKTSYVRRKLNIQKVKLKDETGELEISWYNQPYLIKLFQKAPSLAVSGLVKKDFNRLSLEPKEYEVLKNKSDKKVHTGKLIAIYPEKRGLSSRTIRDKISLVLETIDKIPDFLPPKLVSENGLITETDAYFFIHSSVDTNHFEKARRRLSFDELFTIQLSSLLVRKSWQKETVGHTFEVGKFKQKLDGLIKKLPFKLTGSQSKAISDILKDLSSTHPMNRFLQGDVGSGKTVVSAVAAYLSFLNGFQTLFMAPTEILAQQHFRTISSLLKPLNLAISLQTASSKNKNLDSYDVVIGTHALLSEKLNFTKVGFVVIDEQHKFGVRQRAILKEKGITPHLLTMTATPIPRTVALTLFGELSISVIDEIPKGRIPIKTHIIPKSKRNDMYDWIRKKIKEEDVQVFIVCPLIEESEKETMRSVKAAKKEYDFLARKVFPELKIGLLHGRQKSKEKERIMTDFKDNKYQILVCTSVVEVGIDISNAAVMVIEGAERYGLAQLHQLRGRVGRGSKQSFCLLFCEKITAPSLKRLKFFSQNLNGAKLAKFDLQQRGSGEIYGTRQHGVFELKIADLSDYKLLEKSSRAVIGFDREYRLDDFPILKEKIDAYSVGRIARD